jgi:hypothetical protein
MREPPSGLAVLNMLTLEANIIRYMPADALRDHSVFQKLVIAPDAAVGILARLSAMNIHSASLFPDIDGYVNFIEDNILLFGADMNSTSVTSISRV